MITITTKQISILISLLLLVAILGFITYSLVSTNGIFSSLQNDLKDIQSEDGTQYTDLEGKPIDLSEFKGKPLVINSWATWIPFSQTELPLLQRIQEKYGNAITILAINRMEQLGVIKSYLSTFQISGTIIFLADSSDNFYRVIGGYAMPETVFYNPDGTIFMHKRGVLTESEVDDAVGAMTAQK